MLKTLFHCTSAYLLSIPPSEPSFPWLVVSPVLWKPSFCPTVFQPVPSSIRFIQLLCCQNKQASLCLLPPNGCHNSISICNDYITFLLINLAVWLFLLLLNTLYMQHPSLSHLLLPYLSLSLSRSGSGSGSGSLWLSLSLDLYLFWCLSLEVFCSPLSNVEAKPILLVSVWLSAPFCSTRPYCRHTV